MTGANAALAHIMRTIREYPNLWFGVTVRLTNDERHAEITFPNILVAAKWVHANSARTYCTMNDSVYDFTSPAVITVALNAHAQNFILY